MIFEMIYENEHVCAMGRCEAIAEPGKEICDECIEYISKTGPVEL